MYQDDLGYPSIVDSHPSK